VVGVAEGVLNDIPGIVPFKTFYIDKDALELNNGKSRMGVVQLDGNLVGEFLPGTVCLLEAANDVEERCSTPEVLLLQSEFFATVEASVLLAGILQ
jgi:hypothetical protein